MAPTNAGSKESYLLPMSKNHKLDNRVAQALQELEDDFALPADKLKAIVKQMLWEFEQGLSRHASAEEKDTFLPMIPTYIHNVPDGTEKGTFLALDLGGTNLRVCEVNLLGNGQFTLRQQKFKVSDELKTGTAEALFDYIAESVGNFTKSIEGEQKAGESLFLGFTFSFPVQQTALNKGTLISWTKGFSATGAIDKDVVQLLQSALDRRQIPVRCAALVNDTVGTLLSRAYQSGAALVGAIFGTGTNGAYVERMKAIKKDVPAQDFEYMIINTEWGAFDNERKVLHVTQYDNKCDRKSINPRKQAFEKMVSGMYMGEVVRNVLLHLIDRNLLFKGHSSTVLNKHYGLDTALMSAIETHPLSAYGEGLSMVSDENEWATSVHETRKILVEKLGLNPDVISDADCIVVRRVSEIVGTRGARLSAVAIAAVIIQTGHDKTSSNDAKVSIGVDGSLCEFYPGFETRIRHALQSILGEEVEKRVQIGLAKDGSGIGAALTALQAKKQQEALAQPNPEKLSQDNRTL